LVLITPHNEPEPTDFSASPTLVNHKKPLISKEEFIVPFILCPPPFPVPIGLPLCKGNKVEKSANKIPNPSSHSSPTFHHSDSMEEIPEWLMRPMVKIKSSTLQDDVTVRNSTLEYVLDFCYPLSSTGHDYLYHDPLERSVPRASLPHTLDFHVANSNYDQVQGSHSTRVQ